MTIPAIFARSVAIVVAAWLFAAPVPAAAADREHQQMMADLRMLEQQMQRLQSLMSDLGEALRLVNSRLDDQTSIERKAFADGKVQMDSISGDLRIVREKVDETNVRLGTLSQEMEMLRQVIPEQSALPVAPLGDPSTAAPPPGSTPPPAATAPAPAAVINPERLFNGAWGDYTSGNYSLAASGFQMYLNSFPKGTRAHEAQLLLGESLYMDKKDAEAVAAYDRVIAAYPSSPSVPQAYYKRGQAFERLGQKDRARESFEALIKQFPDSPQATLAKQRL